MGGGTLNALVLGALALLLVSAGIQDARTREIANWKNLAILALAPLFWWISGRALWPDLAIQIGVATLVFALFYACFLFGWMGGGDVKMIAALSFWFPWDALVRMLIAMSLIGGVITIILMIERKLRKNPAEIEIPYGVAIAIAALLMISEPILNQFGVNA
jgi:prepilin peptidase CpaA